MTDYHRKPVLAVRLPQELSGWARDEATRRGQRLGDFFSSLLISERERTTNPAPVAAKPPRPRAGRKTEVKSGTESECQHPGVRPKNRCPKCGRYNI